MGSALSTRSRKKHMANPPSFDASAEERNATDIHGRRLLFNSTGTDGYLRHQYADTPAGLRIESGVGILPASSGTATTLIHSAITIEPGDNVWSDNSIVSTAAGRIMSEYSASPPLSEVTITPGSRSSTSTISAHDPNDGLDAVLGLNSAFAQADLIAASWAARVALSRPTSLHSDSVASSHSSHSSAHSDESVKAGGTVGKILLEMRGLLEKHEQEVFKIVKKLAPAPKWMRKEPSQFHESVSRYASVALQGFHRTLKPLGIVDTPGGQ
jgi:hypothetical protein